MSDIIDRKKVHRARQQLRNEMVAKVILSPIVGIFFDRKRDKTILQKKFDSKYYISNEIEEHVTILT